MDGKKFSELVFYFQKLAAQHVLIKNFYRIELDEILSDLRDLETPCLILEGYKFGFVDQKADNILKNRSGAFVLLDHVKDNGDYDNIHAVWDNLEEIVDDILARMKADRREDESPVRNLLFEQTDGSLVQNEIGGYYGIRVQFDVQSLFNTDVNEARWNR